MGVPSIMKWIDGGWQRDMDFNSIFFGWANKPSLYDVLCCVIGTVLSFNLFAMWFIAELNKNWSFQFVDPPSLFTKRSRQAFKKQYNIFIIRTWSSVCTCVYMHHPSHRIVAHLSNFPFVNLPDCQTVPIVKFFATDDRDERTA